MLKLKKGHQTLRLIKAPEGFKWLARSTNDKSLQIAYCDSIGLARVNKSSKRLILTHIADSKTTELNFRYSKNQIRKMFGDQKELKSLKKYNRALKGVRESRLEFLKGHEKLPRLTNKSIPQSFTMINNLRLGRQHRLKVISKLCLSR